MWKTVLKRTVLVLVVCGFTLTWSQSGRAVDCLVERGDDPLEALATSIQAQRFYRARQLELDENSRSWRPSRKRTVWMSPRMCWSL